MKKNNDDMVKQYLYSKTNYNNPAEQETKENIEVVAAENSKEVKETVETVVNQEMQHEYEKFEEKLIEFNNINNVQDAKDCAKRLFNIDKEINFLRAGDAYITIENRADLLRITVNREKELICYNFNKRFKPETQEVQ